MADMKKMVSEEIKKTGGVLRLAPAWVGRTILFPGRRLKLDVRDLYARGAKYGAICERWMMSTDMVDNGDTTVENEGLSMIVCETGTGYEKVILRDAIAEMGDELMGKDMMDKYGKMISFCKLYDFRTPIPHHVHLMEQHAALMGVASKPEAYYFPTELNSITYNGDYTFFGVDPSITKEKMKTYLENWGETGDNGILEVAKAYKLKLGTGWSIPAGILHAPGSLVTYEPQLMSDTSMFWQTFLQDKYFERDLLVKFIPDEKKWDLDFLIECLDWEANIDPDFKKTHYHEPIPVSDVDDMASKGYYEEWITYGADEFAAKRLVVYPGQEVNIKDAACYGFIAMEGIGSIEGIAIETPAVIRYEQLTRDEYFVTHQRANEGVTIKNTSDNSNLVLLKHFGPDNKDAAKFLGM